MIISQIVVCLDWIFGATTKFKVRLYKSPTYTLFHCNKIATKAIALATERIKALHILGFEPTDEKLVGHDGTKYDSYFVVKKN